MRVLIISALLALGVAVHAVAEAPNAALAEAKAKAKEEKAGEKQAKTAEKTGAKQVKKADDPKKQEKQPAPAKAQPKSAEKAPAEQAKPAAKAATKKAVKAASPKATGAAVNVSRMAICTGIENREPTGKAETFPKDSRKLYCFSHITGAKDTLQIQHKWYRGETLVGTVMLPVRSSSWRTYSARTISEGQTGEWKVEVVDASAGTVLETATFVIE